MEPPDLPAAPFFYTTDNMSKEQDSWLTERLIAAYKKCPMCSSQSLVAGEPYRDAAGSDLTTEVECADCGSAWTEVHTFNRAINKHGVPDDFMMSPSPDRSNQCKVCLRYVVADNYLESLNRCVGCEKD